MVDLEQLVKARNHALRAAYEASEAGILYALDQISEFKAEYKTIVISDIVSGYGEILSDAERAKDRIEVRKNADGDPEKDGDEFMVLFRTLKAHCVKLNLHRDELNKVKRKDVTDTRRFVISVFIGLPTLLFAIVAVVVAIVAWLHPFAPSEQPKPTAPISVSSKK